ncbi:MAG TPA: hypothetical protein DHL02_12070, partial [Achromobacter sp.]|nr:hypothetical protein [Achromobacter sp.]
MAARREPGAGAAWPALARLPFVSKQENIMQKINKPEPSDMAADLQVQPLTSEEIGQVSGGVGTARMLTAVTPGKGNGARGNML